MSLGWPNGSRIARFVIGRGSTSPRTSRSRYGLPNAVWTARFCRGSITTIKSASFTASAVIRLDRWPDKSMPRPAAT